PPLVTAVSAGEKGEARVRLEGSLTEIGTLDLECVEVDSGRRHRLGFEIRKPAREAPPPSLRPRNTSVTPKAEKQLVEAREKIDRVFGKALTEIDPREAKNLYRELERILGERTTWPTAIVRPLFDVVRPGIPNRKRSADHERVFFQLAGFLLRPGFGDPLDPQRVASVVPLWEQRLVNSADANGWRAWWIFWRRIAGGLGEPVQTRIRDTVDPFLAPEDGKPRKKPKGIRAEPIDEVIHLASSLERVPVERRVELGAWVLERTWTSQDPVLYAAIGRIGARVPAYASAHHVVSSRTAESWLGHVLKADWNAVKSAPFAAVQLARNTGDRARDVSENARKETLEKLTRAGARESWLALVREVVEVTDDDRSEAFGEALPPGLRLVD
ncbi:MAG: Hsp70 family protein, partial [Polyangiales bacterium]